MSSVIGLLAHVTICISILEFLAEANPPCVSTMTRLLLRSEVEAVRSIEQDR